MAVSNKVLIGRVLLVAVIAAIAIALVYLFTTNEMVQQTQHNDTAQIKKEPVVHFSMKDSSKLVKDAYENYIKKAYDDKSPNSAVALKEFKQQMTIQAAQGLKHSSKGKDPILCTTGRSDSTSYTEPTALQTTTLITVVSIVGDKTVQAIVTVDMVRGKITSVKCQ